MTFSRTRTKTIPIAHQMMAFLILLLLGVFARSQTQNSNLPLFASSVVNCDEMITLHRWEGNCCSLNVTAGNGCILNVMDGWCNVYGQQWTLNFNSTYDAKPCPDSEYTNDMLGMKGTYDEIPEDSAASFQRTPMGPSTVVAILLGLFSTATALVVLG